MGHTNGYMHRLLLVVLALLVLAMALLAAPRVLSDPSRQGQGVAVDAAG